MESLILVPLRSIDPERRAVANVVDAIDECDQAVAKENLRLLFWLATQIPFLRILTMSRPMPHISPLLFEEPYCTKIYHPYVHISVIQRDIRTYLDVELENIAQKFDLPSNWVTVGEKDALMRWGEDRFVGAAKCIRVIGDDSANNPPRQLRSILDYQFSRENAMSGSLLVTEKPRTKDFLVRSVGEMYVNLA